MARNYTVRTRIERPREAVFDAVYRSEQLDRYFTTRSSSDLIEGRTVEWFWAHWGTNPVRVTKVQPPERIELEIDSVEWFKSENDAYPVRVIFEFEALDEGATMLSISEEGWKTDADGLKASHENCEGWTHMTVCLKAWLEHEIDLR